MECREWTDAQLGNNDSSNDVRDVNLSVAHMLSGPDRDRGCGTGRPAGGRHPRPGPVPAAAGVRRRTRAGLGLHRDLRQGERRRFPDRPLPGRLQGDLGLPRPGSDVAAHPRGPLHRDHPPRPVRHRPLGRPAGRVEPPGAGVDRHRPGPGAPAGAAAAGGRRPGGHAGGGGAGAGRPRGGAHGPGAGERRQPRHQELHPRQPRLLPGARRGRQAVRRRPALLARATARSRSAGPSRWAASSTSGWT